MIKWQEELQGKAWNSLFLGNHDQPRMSADLEMITLPTEKHLQKCWQPVCT